MDNMNIYNRVGKPPKSLLPVDTVYHTPIISVQDNSNGEILRYFCRRTHHSSPGEIVEVSKQTYNSLKSNSMYLTVEVRWLVKGKILDVVGLTNSNSPTRLYTGVETANKLFVEEANKKLVGLKIIITDYIKFWQGE
jgi:hypothetical protein